VGKSLSHSMKNMKNFFVAVCIDNERPILPTDAHASYRALLQSCWHADRKKRPIFTEVDFRLAEVVVDIDIPDPAASTWWKNHFLLPTLELQEPTFVYLTRTVLDKEVRTIGSNIRCTNLKPFLVEEDSPDIASRKKFYQGVQLFGDFYLAQHAATIVPKMTNVKESEWFWGSILSAEATKVLSGTDAGTFLVRISTTHEAYPFALSFSNGPHSAPSHHRIGKRPSESERGYNYFCGELSSDSLCELVDMLIEEFDLIQPCPKEKTQTASYQNDPLQKGSTQ